MVLTRLLFFGVGFSVCLATNNPLADSALANDMAFKIYEDVAHGIHVKYPETWHVRAEDTTDAHEVFLTRESLEQQPSMFKVGMTIMQFHNIADKIQWLDFSDPDKAVNQWLNATLQGTPGHHEVLAIKRLMIGGNQAYYVDLSMYPDGGYPMRILRITIFYPTTFSEITFETPAEEFDNFNSVFQDVINDKDFVF